MQWKIFEFSLSITFLWGQRWNETNEKIRFPLRAYWRGLLVKKSRPHTNHIASTTAVQITFKIEIRTVFRTFFRSSYHLRSRGIFCFMLLLFNYFIMQSLTFPFFSFMLKIFSDGEINTYTQYIHKQSETIWLQISTSKTRTQRTTRSIKPKSFAKRKLTLQTALIKISLRRLQLKFNNAKERSHVSTRRLKDC